MRLASEKRSPSFLTVLDLGYVREFNLGGEDYYGIAIYVKGQQNLFKDKTYFVFMIPKAVEGRSINLSTTLLACPDPFRSLRVESVVKNRLAPNKLPVVFHVRLWITPKDKKKPETVAYLVIKLDGQVNKMEELARTEFLEEDHYLVKLIKGEMNAS